MTSSWNCRTQILAALESHLDGMYRVALSLTRNPITAEDLVHDTAVRALRFRDKFERYISNDRHNAHLRRKAYTAISAKMARTVHAVVKHGEPYRPFFEGGVPRRKDLSL